jgi:hypothetical protein
MNILSNLFAKTTPVVPVATPAIISDEKAEAVKNILVTIGLDEEDHYGFVNQMKKKSSYFGGTMEWSIRENGMRYNVEANPVTGVVTGVMITTCGRTHFRAEDFDRAGRAMDALFA